MPNIAIQEALDGKAVEVYGRVDGMLNNAGLMPLAPLEKLKTDEWDQMIDVNEILFRPTAQPI